MKLPSPKPYSITKQQAQRFMLAHHGLYPPRKYRGKQGVLDVIQHLGCIQFDPINVVGRNPDLVLQSRVGDYQSKFLDELLYEDRQLVDGWDKMASIYLTEDWPYFSFRRERFNQPGFDGRRPPQKVLDEVLDEVEKRGPLSSLDFKESEIVDWHWGPTKIVRAALESLFSMSKVGIDHRVNNRRAFDLIERLIPSRLLEAPNPFGPVEEYQDWHTLRRIGGMGLAHPKSGEYWLGILGAKSRERQLSLKRLRQSGQIMAITIQEIPNQTFYIRTTDFSMLESVQNDSAPPQKAAFIAALDNLIWNRWLVQQIFDFEYIWEVYKPKAKREYGYYVLPVLYGDRFIARVEPKFDKTSKALRILNWWWEPGINPDQSIIKALKECVSEFGKYLGAKTVVRDKKSAALDWLPE